MGSRSVLDLVSDLIDSPGDPCYSGESGENPRRYWDQHGAKGVLKGAKKPTDSLGDLAPISTALAHDRTRANAEGLAPLAPLAGVGAENDSPKHRLWLITLPDGSRISSSNTPPATLAEMRQWFPNAVIEPESEPPAANAQGAQEAPGPTDRRTCTQCQGLAPDGRCRPAGRGELPQTTGRYYPATDQPQRCIAFQPKPADPDQRPGRERWPKLYRRLMGERP